MPFNRRGFLRSFLPCLEPEAKGTRTPTTLVTVFLRGGADGLNMVVPYGDPDYARLRPSLAIAKPGESSDACLDLDGFFGLHPAFAPLAPEWTEKRLAIIHAVGSDDATRSHFEAQDQMEHGAAFDQRVAGGWIARHLRASGAASGLSAVAIGTQIPEALRGAPMAAAMTSISGLKLRGVKEAARPQVMSALGSLYAESGLLGGAGRDTLDLMQRVESLENQEANPAGYPTGGFSSGLRDVARLVKARVGLKTACLDLGGWDTHFFQGSVNGFLAGRIEELAKGLAAFQEDLGSCREHVVVVVMTEFGRRAYENASLGTDHGRGSVMLVLGEGINGGKVHGDWPGLKDDALEGPGDLAVTTDYRAALCEILTRTTGGKDHTNAFPGYSARPVGLI